MANQRMSAASNVETMYTWTGARPTVGAAPFDLADEV